MPVITIKSENDLKELGNSLDEIKYKRSKGRIRGNHRIEPVFRFAENIYKIVLKVELGSLGDESSEELKNIFQILNELTAAFKNIQRQRKLYRRGNILKNNKEKEKYVQDLRNFIILAKKLAEEVDAKELKTSLNKALNDCNSIIKNDKNIKNKEKIREIKDSENPFFELAETFKNLKEQADKYCGTMNEKVYKRECGVVKTLGIGEAIDYLKIYGECFKNGDDESIRESCYDISKYDLNLVNAGTVFSQEIGRHSLFSQRLLECISKCTNSPNSKNVNKLNNVYREAKRYTLYNFEGKYERLLDISKKVIDISKSIIQKEEDIQIHVDVKKAARMFEEKNILKVYFNNAISLCKQIKSDVDEFNSALGYEFKRKIDEVDNLLKTIQNKNF